MDAWEHLQPYMVRMIFPVKRSKRFFSFAGVFFDLEQEIRRLDLIRTHLDENQEVNLNYNELVSYGFSDQ